MDIRQLIFPAGIGLTHIEVYPDVGPDGSTGGSPHLHMVCSEIYYVTAGEGAIELLSFDGFSTVPLKTGQVVFHRPGVVHRLLNPQGNLHVLAIMQNGALPERGDFVMTFPTESLASPVTYGQALRAADHAAAIRRRDLAVQGFQTLRDAMLADATHGRELLRAFYRQARNLMAPKVDGFEWVLQTSGQAEVKTSLDACDFLRVGRTDYLERARHGTAEPKPADTKLGVTGVLRPYALDETFFAEGKKVA